MDENIMMLFPLPVPVIFAIHRLSTFGFEAYVVGGAVRDLLRGETPHDYDIATSATPEEMKRVFDGYRTVETGIKHGTLTVIVKGEPLEITTYRVDGTYTDARHPDCVSFTRSLREDAARRDFTVNAMAYHPLKGLRDFFGGKEDIEAKILRTVGESRLRFTEDALRILRALRFSAVLGYTIERSTADAIHLLKGRLSEVAPERIREELLKLITAPYASEVLREYVDVLFVAVPELGAMVGFEQKNPHHDFDVWEHTLHALKAAPQDKVLRLAVLFHDIGKPSCFSQDDAGVGHFYGHAERSAEIADSVMRRLRFDNETREAVLALVRMHDVLPKPETRQFSRIRSKHGDAFLFDWLALIRADRTGQKELLSPDAEHVLAEAEKAARLLIEKEERMSLSSLAIDGNDLIPLGYRGREIGEALAFALSSVLEGEAENEKAVLLRLLNERRGAPIECERKFLIKLPDERLLLSNGAVASRIVQTYLESDASETARVRMRTKEGKTTYTHTVKRRISSLSAIEEEREIGEEEYLSLIKKADPMRHPIQKTRYVLPYEGHLLEIDVYPFWKKQAVLEIELSDEGESFALPPFLTVLREVTADVAYKNVSLAKVVPNEDKIP